MRRRDFDRRVRRAGQTLLTWFGLVFTLYIVVLNFGRQPRKYSRRRDLPQINRFPLRSYESLHGSGHEPHLKLLLQKIVPGKERTPERVVVALVVNNAYRHLALNFVCNLIRLRIANYIVFSLDALAFEFFVQRKVNTFMFTESGKPHQLGDLRYSRDKEDIFGTKAFIETSRRKSFHVLKLMELGYSVVFSDADVAWLQNPLPLLLQTPADIVIQSDVNTLQKHKPRNYNINSGFYFARSNHRTITAFRAILRYSRAIRRSEQKAFNYVLCGGFKSHTAGPGLRVGRNHCINVPHATTVATLPLDAFPNGSNTQLWLSLKNITETHPKIMTIHANYIFGREEKIRRLKRVGFWFISEQTKSTKDCATWAKR